MKRTHDTLWLLLGALIASSAIIGGVAYAGESLQSSADLETICGFSEPDNEVAKKSTETPVRTTYHQERRRLLQTTWEIIVPSLEVSVIGYDRVTGILTVGGFKDHSVFGGRYKIRLREACGLYFELDEERAADVVSRARLGGVSLQLGFHLDPHDDPDRPICSAEKTSNAASDAFINSPPSVVHIDLLYARLVEPDGTVLATFQTERAHELHLRRVSQAIGTAASVRPHLEVTNVEWQAEPGEDLSSSDASWQRLNDAERRWWTEELEVALFPCYIRGLRRNGRLQGAMVLTIPTRTEAPKVLVDTLRVDDVSECVLERINSLRAQCPFQFDERNLKATFLFKLQ